MRKGGNRSGRNVSPVARVPASADEKKSWEYCALIAGETFAAWARKMLNTAAKRRGFEAKEKLSDD